MRKPAVVNLDPASLEHPFTPPPLLELSILGSTGSLGVQTLDLVRRDAEQYRITALAAGGSHPAMLAQQVLEFSVPVVALADPAAEAPFVAALQEQDPEVTLPQILVGPDAATELAQVPTHTVLNAMTGSVGLAPTMAALTAGHRLALANKESLIAGGELVCATAAPGQIVPVDSEHSALAQLLRGESLDELSRLILTASGGPFRGWVAEDLEHVTAEQALAHPTWSMGPVISVNSATMMNKGLELLEAGLLFGVDLDDIDVVVHPQSVVHSMVEFLDGSTLVQASPPNMVLPIAHALRWPGRIAEAAPPCDWTQASQWHFEPVNHEVFPAITLARTAGQAGGTAPAVFNAANEEAVAGFLAGTIGFAQIVHVAEETLVTHLREGVGKVSGVNDVVSAEAWARTHAQSLLQNGMPS